MTDRARNLQSNCTYNRVATTRLLVLSTTSFPLWRICLTEHIYKHFCSDQTSACVDEVRLRPGIEAKLHPTSPQNQYCSSQPFAHIQDWITFNHRGDCLKGCKKLLKKLLKGYSCNCNTLTRTSSYLLSSNSMKANGDPLLLLWRSTSTILPYL